MVKIKVVAENVANHENKEFSLGRPSGFSLHLLFCLFYHVLGLRLIYQEQAFESKCTFLYKRNYLILVSRMVDTGYHGQIFWKPRFKKVCYLYTAVESYQKDGLRAHLKKSNAQHQYVIRVEIFFSKKSMQSCKLLQISTHISKDAQIDKELDSCSTYSLKDGSNVLETSQTGQTMFCWNPGPTSLLLKT